MKKVLFATVAAVMSTTAAMADVSFSEGRITALMTAANNFESRGINIVENSNKLAVHKTVTAWNQGWNALEGENTVDLDASYTQYTIYHTDGIIVTDNLTVSADGMSATYNNGTGLLITLDAADVSTTVIQNVDMRDSRAAEVSVVEGTSLSDSVGSVGEIVDEVVISISGVGVQISEVDSFDVISDKVEQAVQNSYDAGFEDGYTAGYDDGFAAAKGVVKN